MRRLLAPCVWIMLTLAVPCLSEAFDLFSEELKIDILEKKKDLLQRLRDVKKTLISQEARVGQASKGCTEDLQTQRRKAQSEFDRLDALRDTRREVKASLKDLESFVKAYNAGKTPKWWFVRTRLFVNTEPQNADIKILNIEPKFIQGMELKPGEYLLEVSAPGYRTKRITFEMPQDFKEITVKLVQL
ncbi:MAG: hypothetical protein SWH78_14740 [Thermodesulfobacteriota bacterium]|nr:hypothetical protein [Thermodesulfobacteriota bacterium]